MHRKIDPEYDRPLIGELCRVTWLAFGPAALIFTGAAIWRLPSWTYSALDWAFGAIAVLIVIARYLDIKFFRGSTTDNETATMADWRRYSAKLALFAAAIWILAQWSQA